MKNYIFDRNIVYVPFLGDAENTHTTMSMKVMTMKRKYMQKKKQLIQMKSY